MVLKLSLAPFSILPPLKSTMRRFQWLQVTHKVISSLNEPKFLSPPAPSLCLYGTEKCRTLHTADITHLLLILWRNLIRTWSVRIMCHYEEWQKLWSSINMVVIDKSPLTGIHKPRINPRKLKNTTIKCLMSCEGDKIFDKNICCIYQIMIFHS